MINIVRHRGTQVQIGPWSQAWYGSRMRHQDAQMRIGSTALYLISLLCTTLISYKSESCSLTNARWDFPGQRRKANLTYHTMLGNFLGTSLLGICAWVGTKFQSHNHDVPLSLEQPPKADNTGPLIALTMVVIMIPPLT